MASIIEIENKLKSQLNVNELEITDESIMHKGHQNFKEGHITHIKIKIKSPDFIGKTKVSMHRLIYNSLAEEIKMGLHAISIEAEE